jgi:DNA-binding transcriptional LysR family regulator
MASGGCGGCSTIPCSCARRRASCRRPALALAEPVADLLAQARNVLASAAPFDPATSTRRFVIGAPDGSVFLRPLLAVLRDRAPGIDIGLRQLMPPQGGHSVERAWTPVFAQLEAGAIDIAVAPIDRPPPRFVARMIYDEDFVPPCPRSR